MGKIAERMVAGHLQTFLDDTYSLGAFQSVLRPCHRTEIALAVQLSDLLQAADRGSVTLLVLLDLSAAFNTVDFLDWLMGLGTGGSALSWLHSFLRECYQRLGEAVSSPLVLQCGVPQGQSSPPRFSTSI